MLHKLSFLYHDAIVLHLFVGVLVTSVISEVLARQTAPLPEHAAAASSAAPHVAAHLRHFSLPNYWIGYDYPALREAITVQKDALGMFLAHTVFNATVCTNVVGLFLIFLTMNMATKAFGPQSAVLTVAWLPALASFICDFGEDIALMRACFAFPGDFETDAWVASACSTGKFLAWAWVLLQVLLCAVKWRVAPPPKWRLE